MSHLLCVFLAAVGVDTTTMRMARNSNLDQFTTKPIELVGLGVVNYTWVWHQVVTKAGLVYDSCGAPQVSPTGQPWGMASYGWSTTSFWQTAAGGLVGIPNPASLLTYGFHDPIVPTEQ